MTEQQNKDSSAAEEHDTPTETEASSPQQSGTDVDQETEVAERQEPAHKRDGNLFRVIMVLLLLGALGGSYYLWLQLYHQSKRIDQINLTNVQQQLLSLQQQFDKQQNQWQQRHNQQAKAIEQVQESARILHQDLQKRADHDVRLIEAESLLRLARNRYALEHDIETAMLAMKMADHQLQTFSQPELVAVRQQIESEIRQLQQLVLPQVSDALTDVDHLLGRVDSLPLLSAKPAEIQSVEDPVTTEDAKQGWEKMLADMLKELEPLVRIRRQNRPTPPMLSQEEERLARLVLLSRYESLRMSLMQHDQKNIERMLDEIRSWLQRYFDVSHDAVRTDLKTLDDIATLDLTTDYPALGQALQALTTYRQQAQVQNSP